jgi:uncharacterized membrane protein required for colicin V production
LSFIDRFLGGVFGFVRGALICVAFVAVLLAFAPRPMPNWMVGSKLLPYAVDASNVVASLAPGVVKDAFRTSTAEIRDLWVQEVAKSHEKFESLKAKSQKKEKEKRKRTEEDNQ